MMTSCFCQPDTPWDSCTGHKQGPHASAQHCCQAWTAEGDLVPQVGVPKENPALFPLECGSFIPAATGGRGDRGDVDTTALGSVFQPSARAFQELQNRVRFFLKFLFHSDQLKEMKLRRSPLTNSDLQVGQQGKCHPGCCHVAMEPLTAAGLRLGLGRCAERGLAAPPTRLPTTEGHRARTLRLCF